MLFGLITLRRKMSDNATILSVNIEDMDEVFDEDYEPDHPFREMRGVCWQLQDYMNERPTGNLSRLNAMRQIFPDRSFPWRRSSEKISIQRWLAGLMRYHPDMFRPLISKIEEMLGPQCDYLNVLMRVEDSECGKFDLVILLQIKKKILRNPCELERVFQQAEEDRSVARSDTV